MSALPKKPKCQFAYRVHRNLVISRPDQKKILTKSTQKEKQKFSNSFNSCNSSHPLKNQTMPSTEKFRRRIQRRIMKVYKRKSSSEDAPTPGRRSTLKRESSVPVFMLRRSVYLAPVPEEAAVQRGFNLNVSLRPQKKSKKKARRFTDLLSLENPDEEAMEESAATDVDYQSYAKSKLPVCQ